MTTYYHSAHDDPAADSPPLDYFELGGSIAFCHDLRDGLPTTYNPCDVLYADLPWRTGIATFNHRANRTQDYDDLMRSVSAIVETQITPTILVTGHHALTKLPAPDWTFPVKLNRHNALAIAYRLQPPRHTIGTATDLLRDLAVRFARVGDFCCGYGRALRIFHDHGRLFTGSDYNPHCIGRIAEILTDPSQRPDA